jgi:hypothetical protein
MHRAHAAAIDERPHTEHQIGIGIHDTSEIDQLNYSSGTQFTVLLVYVTA